MSLIKSVLIALAMTFSAATVMAPIAAAQGTTIVVLDQRKVLADSLAGKDIANKLKNISEQINRELKPTGDSLNSEGQSLQSRLTGKTEQQVAADTALVNSLQSFQRKSNDFARKRQIAAAELELTQRKALSDFSNALRPVILEVVREKNAQVVLDRSQTQYVDPSFDSTALIVSKLNSRTKTISVTREKLPIAANQ
jgi:outer membrane protein